jgi:hypothetical protein
MQEGKKMRGSEVEKIGEGGLCARRSGLRKTPRFPLYPLTFILGAAPRPGRDKTLKLASFPAFQLSSLPVFQLSSFPAS